MLLFIEQLLNGLQLGIMLFLMSAGLTLVFGIMQVINLAHGSFYMIGAYVGATVTARTGSFILGILAALPAAALAGMLVEDTGAAPPLQKRAPGSGAGHLRPDHVFQ
jgi:branched-chain amino acid transport system permease protein